MIILLKKAYNSILRKSLHWRLMKAGAIEIDVSSKLNENNAYIELFPLTFRAKISYDDLVSKKSNFITRNYSNYAYTFDYNRNAILINIKNDKETNSGNLFIISNFEKIRVVNLLSIKTSYTVETSHLIELLSHKRIQNVSYLLSVSPFSVKKIFAINFYMQGVDNIRYYSINFEFLKKVVKASLIEFNRDEREITLATKMYSTIDQKLNLDIVAIELIKEMPDLIENTFKSEYHSIIKELSNNLSKEDMTSVYALIEMIKV